MNPYKATEQEIRELAGKIEIYLQSAFCMGNITSTADGLYITVENETRQKSFKRVSTYAPADGDRVLIAKIRDSYVVLGKVV